MSTSILCATCGDKRYVRTARGWTPCASCYTRTLTDTFIHPLLRQQEDALPPTILAKEPWPLTDRTVEGSFDDFRRMAWHSLLYHFRVGLSYIVLDSWRLVEIQFGHDAEIASARDLEGPPLVILIHGMANPPNAFTPELVRSLLDLRRLYAKPTWFYTPRLHTSITAPAGPEAAKLPAPVSNSGRVTRVY